MHGQPAGSGEAVVKYLARYVARTAFPQAGTCYLTLRFTPGCAICALPRSVMRRYLQRVPPPGQHRVRYFGWMHPSATRRRMQVETLLEKQIVVTAAPPPSPAWHLQCPRCTRFTLVRVGTLPRAARGPPPTCRR